MKRLSAMSATDFYKVDHRRQSPDGTTLVFSNFTPRGSNHTGLKQVVNFGQQYFAKAFLIDLFNETFFSVPKEKAVGTYKRRLDTSLGAGAVPVEHIAELHDIGFLPVTIKALNEGVLVPVQCPVLTIHNSPGFGKFYWLPNYLETLLSVTLWGMMTSATVAYEYRKTFERYARITGGDPNFVPWQGHDFSMRGMFGLEAAAMSGAAHLLSFTGTDTIPGIEFHELYYNADAERELIGGSVFATEHAVMAAGIGDPNLSEEEAERQVFIRLLTEVYPEGIVSVVSDTRDFWRVVTKILPSIKDVILNRNGKLVIRPDSGDPVKTLIGDWEAVPGSPQFKGLIECLWDIFGGTVTEEGYKVLDSHIGAIYGDSITMARQKEILGGLAQKGFASTNVVLGIGSFTYQFTTRDTFGFAMKATYTEVNGEARDIFKTPKTDMSKASARGLIAVVRKDGVLTPIFPVSPEFEASDKNLLRPFFVNGKLVRETSLQEIRARIAQNLARDLNTDFVSVEEAVLAGV